MTLKRQRPGTDAGALADPVEDHQQHTFALRQWYRRREAAWRLVPLDCGCRDPWVCRCTEPPPSDRQLDAWRDAALYVLRGHQIPVLPLEALRGLYRRGGPDRVLAEQLHTANGGQVA